MATETSDVARWRSSHEEVWHQVAGRMLPSPDLALPLRHRLYSEASTWSAPGVRITRMILSGVLTSGTRCVVADGADEVALHIISNVDVSNPPYRGHEPLVRNGEAMPAWNAQAHSAMWAAPTRATALQVSRKLLAEAVPGLDDQLAGPNLIIRDNEALRLLITQVDSLLRSVLSKPDLQRLAASHVRDLVAATLGEASDTASLAEEGDVRAARLHAIKTDISKRLSDHDLSVTSVAARQRVTARYVQTLFEREGTTLSAFVRTQRLTRAYDLLADPRKADLPINDVANEAGFSDRSHFNRTFRQRYGVAPSDVRATALRKG